jgi:hypothetical protein|tara:strand:+ start:5129 stop:5317 length:189 start_codon:yes stop_codon:yes gene_type:complete
MKSLMDIKWSIDHDYSSNSYLLVGYYKGTRFVEGVLDKLWGFPLKYKMWLITRKFKILNNAK